MVKPIIFQLVGYQNSGKTTLLKRMVDICTTDGKKVVTIKHHGHGGKPTVFEEKDSSQHMQSGAMASLVEGDGRVLIQAELDAWPLEQQIAWLSYLKPDVIFIEGHKMASYSKAVLLRSIDDYASLSQLSEIRAYITLDRNLLGVLKEKANVPIFYRGDPDFLNWVRDYMTN
ncbi:molybdopterin-guanine dinucleotide biosynthesis protein B [Cytobacillus spongiae]|uniref:molybdopterin-guanine dinucleotide biosynthesis protein B n=1 Tax=Cytobacillus spongiae TaxID=2901381 RepID=UPI001F1697E7|nr:molybdopterin-guanine dinucleotide biosynthesis protein B [Cytobacillus spongiae]UII56985.1 molybdopterin-guanine dinucleotide biosynthesis protein B [Cytobacillus spongiae]